MMDDVLLSVKQRDDLLKVLGCFAPAVEWVDVYGSRARGDARPGSDVDLVLGGALNLGTVLRVASALEDSYLSIAADVTAYALLKPGRFAEQVRRDARRLFSAAELAAAPPFWPVEGLREWYRPVAA